MPTSTPPTPLIAASLDVTYPDFMAELGLGQDLPPHRFYVAGLIAALADPSCDLSRERFKLIVVAWFHEFEEQTVLDIDDVEGEFRRLFPELDSMMTRRRTSPEVRLSITRLAVHLHRLRQVLADDGILVCVVPAAIEAFADDALAILFGDDRQHQPSGWEFRPPPLNAGTKGFAECTYRARYYSNPGFVWRRQVHDPRSEYDEQNFDADGTRVQSATRPGRPSRNGRLARRVDRDEEVVSDPAQRERHLSVPRNHPALEGLGDLEREGLTQRERYRAIQEAGEAEFAHCSDPGYRQHGARCLPYSDTQAMVMYRDSDYPRHFGAWVRIIAEHTTQRGDRVLVPFAWDDNPPRSTQAAFPLRLHAGSGHPNPVGARFALTLLALDEIDRSVSMVGHFSTWNLLTSSRHVTARERQARGIHHDTPPHYWRPRWPACVKAYSNVATDREFETYSLDLMGSGPNPCLGADGGLDGRYLNGQRESSQVTRDTSPGHFTRAIEANAAGHGRVLHHLSTRVTAEMRTVAARQPFEVRFYTYEQILTSPTRLVDLRPAQPISRDEWENARAEAAE